MLICTLTEAAPAFTASLTSKFVGGNVEIAFGGSGFFGSVKLSRVIYDADGETELETIALSKSWGDLSQQVVDQKASGLSLRGLNKAWGLRFEVINPDATTSINVYLAIG
jgi:hypothetical protein